MTHAAKDPEAASFDALVQAQQVHRDIYVSEQVFEQEMKRLWARSWLFVGHDSQIPKRGDFITTDLAGQAVLMVRGENDRIVVLHNRCAHKGAPIKTEAAGEAGRALRCPYHGWSFRLDGSLLGVPVRAGYEQSSFDDCPASRGLTSYGETQVYRGFVFARASFDGPGFEDSMGELLKALDLICDRSPEGRLRVAGGVLRTEFHANWKVYLENINDAFHPVTTHASATQSAGKVWAAQQDGASPTLAMRQLLPFASGYQFFEEMGARVLPHGHSVLGTKASLHTAYAHLGDYGEALRHAHGQQRSEEVMAFAPQNVVFYPSMALKGSPQVMRVLRPLAANRTVIEAWAFEPVGAPPEMLHSALLYNRQVFSPMSMVAHDDLHLFEGIQRSLETAGNLWVSLHRGAGRHEAALPRDTDGIDEALLRNQYLAWAQGMAPAMTGSGT